MCWWVGGDGKVLEAGACGLDGNGGTGDVSGKYNYRMWVACRNLPCLGVGQRI